jgi:hypothetical protein
MSDPKKETEEAEPATPPIPPEPEPPKIVYYTEGSTWPDPKSDEPLDESKED